MSSPFKYQWHDEWIKESVNHFSSFDAMRIEYNRVFNDSIPLSTMIYHCNKQLGIHREYNVPYTEEQLEWLKENYPSIGAIKTHKLFNERFKEHRTLSSVKQCCIKFCDPVKEEVALKNKLQSVKYNPNSKRKIRETGSMRLASGRWYMKDDNGKWDLASRVIYRKHYGDIPKGYAIILLDGNANNLEPDNLYAVHSNVLGVLSRKDWFTSDKELTKTACMWAELYLATK